jgi:hypothetical protein
LFTTTCGLDQLYHAPPVLKIVLRIELCKKSAHGF